MISWNVNGRVGQLPAQLEALGEHRPDLVALQQVRERTAPELRAGLQQLGLAHVADNAAVATHHNRTNGELLASRWPFQAVQYCDPAVPLPERLLSATIDSPWGPLDVYNAHIPDGSTYGAKKVETFEHLFKRLAHDSPHARILCGDFNTPQAELPDGQIVTWGQEMLPSGGTRWRTWGGRGVTGKRWDRAERLILDTLAVYDLPDVYRTLHGYAVQEASWYWKGTGGHVGRRFDHVFASERLHALECRYLHAVRERGLSDHAAVEAVFEPRA